jgi:RimJ/RimL family protein N-acetyltransferase
MSTVELHDGSTVVVRPVRPEDKGAIGSAFQRMGEASRYQRFLTLQDRLSTAELRYLTEVDHHDHEALVAYEVPTGEGVGAARFIRLRDDPVVAEAAVAVIDEWQGRGLGTVLCRLLADRAREEGVERFTALLLASNQPVMALLASLGASREVSREGALVEVEVDLPAAGIGEDMRGVLRQAASGGARLADALEPPR